MWIKLQRLCFCFDERLECSKDNDFKLLVLPQSYAFLYSKMSVFVKLFTKFTLQMGSNATLK